MAAVRPAPSPALGYRALASLIRLDLNGLRELLEALIRLLGARTYGSWSTPVAVDAGGGAIPIQNAAMLSEQNTIEVFSPPYLFRGARPAFAPLPAMVHHGQRFEIQTPNADAIARVVLVRPMAATHQTDTEQRVVQLPFHKSQAGVLTATMPDGLHPPGIAPRGYYMVFIVNTDGVPSEARFVFLHGLPFQRDRRRPSSRLDVAPGMGSFRWNFTQPPAYIASTVCFLPPIGVALTDARDPRRIRADGPARHPPSRRGRLWRPDRRRNRAAYRSRSRASRGVRHASPSGGEGAAGVVDGRVHR